MTDLGRLASVIIRILAAAVIAYEGVALVGQAVLLGLVPALHRGAPIMLGPLTVIAVAVLVFQRSRAVGEWIVRGA